MAYNFDNKDYGDYFKALEHQLNKSHEPKIIKSAPTENITTPITKKCKKGVYRVVRLRKSVIASVLAVILIITVSVVTGINKSKPTVEETKKSETVKDEAVKKEPLKISYTFKENAPSPNPTNDAKSLIIIDKSDNSVVTDRNAHQKEYPASTTKIMTLLVAAENLKSLDDTFTITYAITDPLYVEEASVAGFLNNEVVNMKDLLYGTILPSGADAATALAIKISGNEEEFVKLMNEKVKELGLKNTHFTNPTGLHNEENYSTAYDMAIILDAAMQNKLCREVLSTYQYTTAVTPQHPEGILLSSTLFSHMYGNEPKTATILGGKTGFVNESGYCVASFGKGNETGKEYIVVSMGNSSKWPAYYGQIDMYREFCK